ncbi:glycerate kinase family protein [Blastococcus haudaquaticus]|uniref:Glycerate kinase n=1 Tax=Blastococcus haudaquaticus TaxID=1938745 RepID=A0A286GU18_9ACTN|nr:glycerate kinase [Blastococcus haudaquaticus]SOD99010.1 glycerate kinase [Blastococcus haudaquaticus]
MPDSTPAGGDDDPSPRILVCPDSFKGTFSAQEVATAVADGVQAAGGRPTVLPLADGGEGTAETLLDAVGGRWIGLTVRGPLGAPVQARLALLAGGDTAVVDVAAASGLPLVAEQDRDAERASSYGTGQLIAAAVAEGARTVYVACGGSATTDGGEGAVRAIADAGGLRGAHLLVLSDVTTVFEEAAVVFGPQKGASPAAVDRLTHRLHQLAGSYPRDPRGHARTGAAGGLAGALWAFFDANLTSGIDTVMDAVQFDAAVGEVDAVITGEGRLDDQSTQGKVVSGVLRRAQGRPVYICAGQVALPSDAVRAVGICAALVASTIEELCQAGAGIARISAVEQRPW